MDKKAIFSKTYANLPLGARDEIIAVVEGEPVTWKAARLEIEQDTQKGDLILDLLFKLKILTDE